VSLEYSIDDYRIIISIAIAPHRCQGSLNMQPIKTDPVGIYARFSTDLQDERSIEDQVGRCREYVKQQGATRTLRRSFTTSLNPAQAWSALGSRR